MQEPKTIGIITTDPEILQNYFPTKAEPNFISSDPYYTPDDLLVVDQLKRHGVIVKPIIWGTTIQNPEEFDAIIMRSPWGYMEKQNTIIDWLFDIERLAIKLYNPASLMTWLLDKHYLGDLHKQGVQITPTIYLEKNATLNLTEHLQTNGAFILKPCISAGGAGLFYIQNENDIQRYQLDIEARLKQQSYMLQPFVPEIKTRGEWSCIFINGQYSHSIHKLPASDSILVQAEQGGSLDFISRPSKHIIDFANATYEKIMPAFQQATDKSCNVNDVLYMRLDIIDAAAGPMIIECEGVEPELFFRAHLPSINTFCDALLN